MEKDRYHIVSILSVSPIITHDFVVITELNCAFYYVPHPLIDQAPPQYDTSKYIVNLWKAIIEVAYASV